MAEINRPRPSVEELTGTIREEISRHSHGGLRAFDPATAHTGAHLSSGDETRSHDGLLPPLLLQADSDDASREQYHIRELLKYHDARFIQNAYRAILKRQPDREGFESHLESLRSGAMNKIDVLASLRYSKEGRDRNVQVDGLRMPAAIRKLGRLPLIGYPIRLGMAFLRLPVLIRNQQQFEAHTLAQHERLADYSNRLSEALAVISHRQEALEKAQIENAARLAEDSAHLDARINEESANLQQFFHEQFRRTRAEVALQGQRLQKLFEESRTTGASQELAGDRNPTEALSTAAAGDSHFLDAFYAALEDRFRGSRWEIKERFQIYLAQVRASASVDEQAPLLDLGCGRGEWLELLREEGIKARGVDQNSVLLDECRALGLDVTEGDVLDYLKNLPDKSLGAVTGFHIIEHLPIEALVRLIDESLRVLRPGGLLLFETPNPENVLVGSHFFYFDPTHRNPLPALLMKFLLEARGFAGVVITNLHPWTSAEVEGDNDLTRRFNELFYGPMDYSIRGQRGD